MFEFDNSYASLPKQFYQKINPSPVSNPSLIKINTSLATELGLDPQYLQSDQGIAILSGNQIAQGSQPLAQAYAGHQFGNFVPQLGDGRANLLGEIIDINGKRRDLQLKGSGQTQFSRAGDGRAGLGPVIREFIVSEAMHALGVPTTRALAAISSGDQIQRETQLPGAILTRVASSHIRVGTFEYFIQRRDFESLKILADYVINRHYPEIVDSENPYAELLRAVAIRQAKLISEWMQLGFIHGVMNTDNCSIAGETIDYGPCAFMNFYNPSTVFSSIDRMGRYAYGQQGLIGQWNLSIFANAILSLIDPDQDQAIKTAHRILEEYAVCFLNELDFAFMLKIGIQNKIGDSLAKNLLTLMQNNRADFTLSFHYLTEMVSDKSYDHKFIALFDTASPELNQWIQDWRQALSEENKELKTITEEMSKVNPVYIPRNHIIEEMIEAAVANQDYSLMDKLYEVLAKPFTKQEGADYYMLPPRDKEQRYQTFCGT
ncbi:MAG: YdiU family protein [Cyanobacteria bacterium]|nr:YdiU family protein [Cyanobacteriota bacterium]MDA1020347.1 YdiU family protein [Cyanobacteriota bacterium]